MRLWSLHPKYLDARGLCACWRESLLAKAVLTNKTNGYTSHPQLQRFKQHPEPVKPLLQYLLALYEEGVRRGYSFDKRKIKTRKKNLKLNVTSGQIYFEFEHLKKKLWKRDRIKYSELKKISFPDLHPLFKLIDGEVEEWERGWKK